MEKATLKFLQSTAVRCSVLPSNNCLSRSLDSCVTIDGCVSNEVGRRIEVSCRSPVTKLITGLIAIFCCLEFSANSTAEEFAVNLKSGSVLTIEAGEQTIAWTDVEANGEMRRGSVRLSEVKELVLSDSPVSQQVARIRQQLTNLTDPSYLKRESAEDQLSDNAVAGRFRSLIQAEAQNPNLEMRHRVARILERLEHDRFETGDEFDVLTLLDGTQRKGDAGELNLKCMYREQSITLNRTEIHSLTKPNQPIIFEAEASPVAVEVFQQFENQFYQPQHTTIDFETAPTGEDLARNTDVSEMYVPFGVLLDSEKTGFVGVSGYGFRFPMPPKENSVSVFETMGPNVTPKKFEGVMEFRFCLPNQRSIMAGVHEFGVFIARVDQPRDFIVETYNAEGQVLATIESSDLKCVFTGVKSSEPITFVRILSNPFLYSVTRKIDEDYAIDNLCFSPPVAVSGARDSQQGVVRMKNGDLLNGESIVVNGDQVEIRLTSLAERIEVPISELKSLRFETKSSPTSAGKRKWLAMLSDRSVIEVDPDNQFHSERFGGFNIEREQIAALWLANNKLRFPIARDTDDGQSVMVFPTCRLTTPDLSFRSGRFTWSEDKKLEQDLWLENGGANRDAGKHEDPTPQLKEVEFAKTSPELIPSLWLLPPPGRQPNTGLVRLIDGEQFVLGGSSGFAIGQFSENGLTLAMNGRTDRFSFEEILSIDFPGN